jgi:hypothetical protein
VQIAPIPAPTEQVTAIDPEKIKSLKTALENEAKSAVTPEGLTKILEKLKDEKDIDTRAVITSYVWSKLVNNGFLLTLQN